MCQFDWHVALWLSWKGERSEDVLKRTSEISVVMMPPGK